jgi:hypothetical protein
MPAKGTGYQRARRAFPLAGLPCDRCGAPAAERHHVDGDVFNNTPANVQRLCTPCHHLAHQRTHCLRGHPFTPENTILSPGHRECRICKRERDRKRS